MKTIRTVRNCFEFAFKCPRTWNSLAATKDDDVRHCAACDRNVFFCRTDEETIARARAGECIAREMPDASEVPETVIGMPDPATVKPPTPEQQAASLLSGREWAIARALEDFKYAHRVCPSCRWPMPDWKRFCTVCGKEIGKV